MSSRARAQDGGRAGSDQGVPILTLFSSPKPFVDPHISTIQRNAIRSWLSLGGEVEVLVIGDEPGVAETCQQLGVRHLPDVERNASGTPLLDSIFERARGAASARLLVYVNADILFTSDLVNAAKDVSGQAAQFLMVGQRWDMAITQKLSFEPGWEEDFRLRVRQEGRLHPPAGSDYFVFPKECFVEMPRFALGRAGWDNWMIYKARKSGWLVVDSTASLMAVHQDHDYSHLPHGRPHYRLPESEANVRLAGGRRTMFTLEDADRQLVDGQLRKLPRSWERFRRAIEVYPLVNLHSPILGEITFGLTHPVKAWGEWRGRLLGWLRGTTGSKKVSDEPQRTSQG